MPLHPRDELVAILARHPVGLGLVHGGLDVSIQEVAARWVSSHPDLTELHGGVWAGDVRALLLKFLECQEFENSSLNAAIGPNCQVLLYDNEGVQQAIVRKHPRNYETGELLPVSEFPDNTLWGPDYSSAGWEPYIFWEANLKTQVLGNAWIAAAANMDSPSKTVIYAKRELPLAIFPAVTSALPDDKNDGWDHEFPQSGEGGAPTDSA